MAKELSEKTTYYMAYEGNKCPIRTFYGRISKGMSWEDAIKPRNGNKKGELRKYYEAYQGEKSSFNIFTLAVRHGVPKAKAIQKGIGIKDIYVKEYKWWNEYQGPKCSFSTFIQRNKMRDYERQIRPGGTVQRISGPTHEQAKKVIPKSYYEIDITYKPEETEIFHSIYRGMINKIEEKIYELEDTSTLHELESNLSKIKQEYQTFLTFNPLNHV